MGTNLPESSKVSRPHEDSSARTPDDEATTGPFHASASGKPWPAPQRPRTRTDHRSPSTTTCGTHGPNHGSWSRRTDPPGAAKRGASAAMNQPKSYRQKQRFDAAGDSRPVAAQKESSGRGVRSGRPIGGGGPQPHNTTPCPRVRRAEGTRTPGRTHPTRATPPPPGWTADPTSRPRTHTSRPTTAPRGPPAGRPRPLKAAPPTYTTLAIVRRAAEARLRAAAQTARTAGRVSTEARTAATEMATPAAADLRSILRATDADIMRATAAATRTCGSNPSMTAYLVAIAAQLKAATAADTARTRTRHPAAPTDVAAPDDTTNGGTASRSGAASGATAAPGATPTHANHARRSHHPPKPPHRTPPGAGDACKDEPDPRATAIDRSPHRHQCGVHRTRRRVRQRPARRPQPGSWRRL